MNDEQSADVFTLGDTSTTYMSGNAVYNVRRKNKAGIVVALVLSPDSAEKLIASGVFERHSWGWNR